MAYNGLPEHLLQAVSPEALRHHVLSNGWAFSAVHTGRFEVFNHPEKELEQILIPLNIAAADYPRRIGDAILVLAEVEGRPTERVLTDLLRAGHLGHFRIPGEATRRDYAVYIMVATHRISGERRFYVGKTGDNREGCNPVISRAGNHFSFNLRHAQMRNHVEEPEKYDFDYFYSTFGAYVPPSESRERIELINEMERRLSLLAQEELGGAVIIKPYMGRGRLSRDEREKRKALASPERLEQLRALVAAVRSFVGEADSSGKARRGGRRCGG